MQKKIQSQSLVFLKVFSNKGMVYSNFFLFMRMPGVWVISSINRRNGRKYFTLCWVKDQQSEALLLQGKHVAVNSEVVLPQYWREEHHGKENTATPVTVNKTEYANP